MGEKRMSVYVGEMDKCVKEHVHMTERAAAKMEMTAVEAFVLGAEINCESGYLQKPYCTQGDLAEAWLFPKQTIHSAVLRLEKRGLVRLEPVPGNRKEKAIVLTEAGRTTAIEKVLPYGMPWERAMERMEPWERETMIALLSKYNRLIAEEIEKLEE